MTLQRFNSVGGGSSNGSKPRLSSRITPRMSSSSLTSSGSSSPTASVAPSSPASPAKLVALRYEETVQAKPPIMITKRSNSGNSGSSSSGGSTYLARSRSTLSTRSLATTASSRLSTAAANNASSVSMPVSPLSPTTLASMPSLSPSISPSSASTPTPLPSPGLPQGPIPSQRYPLVILRPPGLIAPPAEQHPALRTPTFHPIVEEGGEATKEAVLASVPEITEVSTATAAKEGAAAVAHKENRVPCKRDSILASSSASTVSQWPEDGEHEESRHDEDEDDEDDGYSSCMCRSGSRRSKVVSMPAPVREAPLPPTADKASAPVTNSEANEAINENEASEVSSVQVTLVTTTVDAPSGKLSQEQAAVQTAAATAATTEEQLSAVSREKSWRLPRTSFSFRAGSFQRSSKNSKKGKKHSTSLDSSAAAVPLPATPPVQCEDGLIPIVVPGSDDDANRSNGGITSTTRTSAHENENENSNSTTSIRKGYTAGVEHALPAVTVQAPLRPVAGPWQLTGLPLGPAPAVPVPSGLSARPPHVQPTTLARPNASWSPMLASDQHAPLGTNTTHQHYYQQHHQHHQHEHLPSPPLPLPSISSFASFPTPSLPSLPSHHTLPPPLSPSSSSSPSSPPPVSQPHFFLRVLSMSDSRQKKDGKKDSKKITKKDHHHHRERDDATETDAAPSLLLNTTIPTERLIEDDFLQSLTFSKRGSLMFGGKRAVLGASPSAATFASFSSSPSPLSPLAYPPMGLPPLAPAVERESLQVRSLYASGSGANASDGQLTPAIAVSSVAIPEEGEGEEQRQAQQQPALAHPASAVVYGPPPHAPLMSSGPASALLPTLLLVQTGPPLPDVASLSVAPSDHLRPDATASNPAVRTSIVSAASATTASTGVALTEGTESSLSLVPSTTPQPSEPPSPLDTVIAGGTTSTSAPVMTLSSPTRNKYELAGGLEDWEDVDVADVDRFGFIHVRRPRPATAASSTGGGDENADELTVLPSSTSLGNIGRHFSRRHQSPSVRRRMRTPTFDTGNGGGIAQSVHTSRTTSTTAIAAAAARSSIRAAANQLPHNKDRRWIDEAGEMLTLEPGLADIAEDEDAERLADVLKRKEWERAEKWRRMAKIKASSSGTPGAGLDFEFDLHHPKLVERTWKGIPDRWRAAAWYSFLASSAQRRRSQRLPPVPSTARTASGAEAPAAPPPPAPLDGGETDTQIIAAFHRLQDTASPDDVQIDLDVPRTVNGHVMFRKRYRGGQRLLFRVLHAVSLYFHATGYVQGMASLAATLLCYYDEERCFVMLVRLFQLRGLERLYEPGFGGLMEALGEFEQQWLARSNRRVAQKLSSLSIDATTYATRWYLTLFNLSVPFSAQLRIWDVFMLLGDADHDGLGGSLAGLSSSSRPGTARTTRPSTAVTARTEDPQAETGISATAMITANAPAPIASKANLAILHATSTALIDGLQEVLLDADFENAMKAVTSWVPIKDDELLMKVVHAEWKRHQKRKLRKGAK
ncbi:hypothetical protein SEUCBS139899_006084 [Sporothrix eucalyptigena]|uniref:Rab-GAP TBC domain-containing protein n=1 Tax=Sporothrix eucalyptigena TaxID=1812306 RepID=A0ABP0CVA9_9PEZI